MKKVVLHEKTESGFEEILPKTSADNVDFQATNITATNVQEAIEEIANSIGSISGDVTGIKGEAETEYRKGNVNITKANIGLGNVDNTSDINKPVSTAQQSAIDAVDNKFANYISTTQKGASGGVASLDTNGKVPSSQLPSYVDDVLEYANLTSFPTEGETGKIYIAIDTNKTYRWSGSGYAEISASLALGETSSTAYAGDKGKANADAITALQTRVGNVESKNTSQDTAISTAQSTADTASSTATEALGKANTNASDISKIVGGTTAVGKANTLSTPRAISLSGDANGSADFDGSAPTSITVTLANTGVTAGTYSVLTVDAKGRATAGGQIIAYGAEGDTPPTNLAVGGLWITTKA